MFSGNSAFLQNTRLTGAQVNQVYLSMGKAVDGRHGLDIGGTVDFTWGSDAYKVQTAGIEHTVGNLSTTPVYPSVANVAVFDGLLYPGSLGGGSNFNAWGTGDYFSAFAQAYAEIAYGRWNVKGGKFYLPFGSDSYKSTENFFYSWSSNAFITPITGGGVLVTYKVNNQLSVLGGWLNGLEQVGTSSDNNALLGGLVWTPSKRLNLRYSFATGKDTYGPNGSYRAQFSSTESNEYFVQSLTATMQINKRLKYVFDWSYNQSQFYDTGVREGHYSYGLNNELIYQYNKNWALGMRFGTVSMIKMPSSNFETEWNTVAFGANWTPTKWLIVKPEVRYDWTDKDPQKMFNPAGGFTNTDTRNTYQLSGGMSAVVKF